MKQLFTRGLIIICVTLPNFVNIQAIVYYVDATNGNDSDNGIIISTPWKTLSKVNSSSFSAGDTLLFKRNEIWNGQLIFSFPGTPSYPIVIGAYGTGNKPVITVNSEYSGTWSDEGGNIWKIADLNFQPWRVRVEGVEKLMAVSIDEMDGIQYFWYLDTDDVPWDVTSADIYLYSITDPNTLLIELNEERFSFRLKDVHNVIVRDLDIQGGNDGCFSITGSSDVSLINNQIGAYARFGVTLSSSHDIIIDSCIVDARFEFEYDVSSQRGPQDGITTWGQVQNLEVKNSTIRTWGHNCIYFHGYGGNTVPGNNIVHDCLLEGINSYSRAFETGETARNNEFYNNIVRHFTASSQLGGNNNFFHHNIFYDFKNSPVKDYPIGQVFTFQQFEGGPDTDNRIENNLFADIDEQALNYIAGGQWTGSIEHNTFKNNIIYNAGRNPRDPANKGVAIKWPSCDAVVGENYSNNCIYNPSTNALIIYRGSKMTVDEFNNQNSNEDTIQNNISEDPLFKDVENRDFHLNGNSPCINAGITVPGMDKDFDGNAIPYGTGPDIGVFEYTGNLPSGNTFLDYDCIGTGYGEYATNPSEEPYIPEIIIDTSKIIYASPEGGGDGSSEAIPTALRDALKSNPEAGTTIIALDGTYSLGITISNLKYVNVISKNKHGAIVNTDGQALVFSDNQDIHHVNFIGFEVTGGGVFIFSPSTLTAAIPHHIYISDFNMHDLFMGIYSGLHSHDWTMDRCLFYNSTMSYLWYMMGFHQTVINSIMYNNSYYSISIRGHYPLNENFDYNHPENNIPITDRDSSFLSGDDWTHMIVNNTFGSCTNTSRSAGAHMVIFYNMPSEDPAGQGEDVYFPPQNIVIANNVFVDDGPLKKKGLTIFAERGINTGEVWSVNGIQILHNVIDKTKLIIEEDYSIESIDRSTNVLDAEYINFVNATNRDYRLTDESSDLLNTGFAGNYFPNNDFSGKLRDNALDIGAYEYDAIVANISETQKGATHVKLFPNPSHDYFHIKLPEFKKEISLSLYDNLMRQIKTFDLEEFPDTPLRIDVTDFQTGLYYLILSSEGRLVNSEKFIVIK